MGIEDQKEYVEREEGFPPSRFGSQELIFRDASHICRTVLRSISVQNRFKC